MLRFSIIDTGITVHKQGLAFAILVLYESSVMT